MEYRILPHGGDKVSVIGLGAGSLHEGSPEEIRSNPKVIAAYLGGE